MDKKAMAKAFEAASVEVSRLHWAYTHAPTAEYRTGRIAGTDSRYTLRVWDRNSDTLAVVIHHHPGQSDSLLAVADLFGAQCQCYATTAHDDESYALSDLVRRAMDGFHARSRVAVEV